MIKEIDVICWDWAFWCRKQDDGLGYPSMEPFVKEWVPKVGFTGAHIPTDFDEVSWKTEQAIQNIDAGLKEIVYSYYLHKDLTGRHVGTTVDQMARYLKIHRDTVYSRLHDAHRNIWEHLYLPTEKRISR